MPLMPQRLHTRLLLAVTLAMVTGTLGLALWTSTSQSNQLVATRLQQARLLTANLAEGSAHSYVVEDYATLEHYLRQAVMLPGLRKVLATDTHGVVLSSLRRSSDNADAELSDDEPTRIALPTDAEPSLHQQGQYLIAWQPVKAGGLLGWLRVQYALDDIHTLQSQIWLRGIILSLVEALMGIGLFVLLLRRPIQSINALSAFARELPHHKGATIPVEDVAIEIQDLGESLNYASQELYRIEQELLELNRTLEERVEREVTQSREKDALLLQQARYQTLGELLVNIAHHWRQPLNAIGASIQECAYRIAVGEVSPQQAPEKITEIMLILQQLSRSIEGFRQICQPSSGQPEPFLTSDAAQRAINLVQEGYHQQGIELELVIISEQPLCGTLQDMVQCFLNLFSNARDAIIARHEAAGRIRVLVAATAHNSLQVSVTDNGGGIPRQLLATLFDPYVTSKFRAQGVGLGLFVVRQTIEQRFNGTVTARNTENGAELLIELPLPKENSQ